MPSKKKRKLEVEDGSPDIPVLRALREELSLPYLPELFYPNEGDDEDPMRGRETRESATSSAPDSWTSVEFREIDGVKRVVGLSLDNRLLKEVPMTHLKKLDALESLKSMNSAPSPKSPLTDIESMLTLVGASPVLERGTSEN